MKMRLRILKFGEISIVALVKLLLLSCWVSGCSSQQQTPPVVQVLGVRHGDEFSAGQVVKPQIKVTSGSPVKVDILLNGKPYVSGAPITDPGHYNLQVHVKPIKPTKEMMSTYIHMDFWILLPIEVRLLEWSYRPQRDGYANLDTTLYIASNVYPIKRLEYTECQLQLWIETTTGVQQIFLDPHRLIFLKDRATQQIRAALISFKASHLSRKIPNGKVVQQPPHQPRLKGALWYRGWLARFNETFSLKTDEASFLSQRIDESFIPARGVIGSP